MARLPMLDPEDFSPALKAAVGATALANRVGLGSLRVWANRPEIAAAHLAFSKTLARETSLPVRLLEIVRLRIAFHNQCRSCMATRSAAAVGEGVTEDLVCELVRPEEAPDLTAAERSALRYADLMATDHLSITDATFDDLRQHFSDDQIIDLGIHIGVCVGFGRLAMSWNMVDELPDAYRTEGTIVPSAGTPVLR